MNDVKFADMTVGDCVIFKKAPARGAPIQGRVTALTKTHITYSDAGVETTLRRASLVADSRVRIEGNKWSWLFE